jgi:hypothetical protein
MGIVRVRIDQPDLVKVSTCAVKEAGVAAR